MWHEATDGWPPCRQRVLGYVAVAWTLDHPSDFEVMVVERVGNEWRLSDDYGEIGPQGVMVSHWMELPDAP